MTKNIKIHFSAHLFNAIFYCKLQPVKVWSAEGVRVLTCFNVPIQYGLYFLCGPTQVEETHHKVFTLHGESLVIILQHTLENTLMQGVHAQTRTLP